MIGFFKVEIYGLSRLCGREKSWIDFVGLDSWTIIIIIIIII